MQHKLPTVDGEGKSDDIADEFKNFADVLRIRAKLHPQKTAFRFLTFNAKMDLNAEHLTYSEFNQKARYVAGQLTARGLHGKNVLLLHAAGADFITGFFACLYAGVVAIPVNVPFSARLTPRLDIIAKDSEVTCVLTSDEIKRALPSLCGKEAVIKKLEWVSPASEGAGNEAGLDGLNIDEGSLAFLQYTSGSTSSPKGVMVTHGNLLQNARVLRDTMELTPDGDRGFCWLPHYHDMGLIGGLLQGIFTGYDSVVMSPIDFMQHPYIWLMGISRYKATISGAPNFAYELCMRKTTPEMRKALDLSSWRIAFNGAEPVRSDTINRFMAEFKDCGFKPQAFYPCYGMAEATLIASGGVVHAAPIVKAFDKQAILNGSVIPLDESQCEAFNTKYMVACGRPVEQITIVNPDTKRRCRAHEIGEIWIKGPSVAQGYWESPAATAECFDAHLTSPDEGPFLRTGDLGFLHEGELYVTGRLKDLIIIRGENYYPQDLEVTAQSAHGDLRQGCNAAFAVDLDDAEKLILVQEVRKGFDSAERDTVCRAIREKVLRYHMLEVDQVVLIKAGTIPKTSSGKIKRAETRGLLLGNRLAEV